MSKDKKNECLRLIENVKKIFQSHGCSERTLKEIEMIPKNYHTDQPDYDFKIEGLKNIIRQEDEDGLKILNDKWGDYGKEGSILPYIEYPD